jgi:hypothetical protein
MEELLRFLQRFEVWIYVVLGVAILVYARKVYQAYQDWKGAMFGLERESAQRNLNTVSTILVLLFFLALTELLLVSFVVPAYPRVNILRTPTLSLLVTPTTTLVTTVTPGGEGNPQEAAASQGCVKGQIEWLSPNPGEEISGKVVLKGTVNVPNMGYYKYEFTQPGRETWTTIAADNKPITESNENLLGNWDTTSVIPGDYLLRIVVSDSQNKPMPACIIPVQVAAVRNP